MLLWLCWNWLRKFGRNYNNNKKTNTLSHMSPLYTSTQAQLSIYINNDILIWVSVVLLNYCRDYKLLKHTITQNSPHSHTLHTLQLLFNWFSVIIVSTTIFELSHTTLSLSLFVKHISIYSAPSRIVVYILYLVCPMYQYLYFTLSPRLIRSSCTSLM